MAIDLLRASFQSLAKLGVTMKVNPLLTNLDLKYFLNISWIIFFKIPNKTPPGGQIQYTKVATTRRLFPFVAQSMFRCIHGGDRWSIWGPLEIYHWYHQIQCTTGFWSFHVELWPWSQCLQFHSQTPQPSVRREAGNMLSTVAPGDTHLSISGWIIKSTPPPSCFLHRLELVSFASYQGRVVLQLVLFPPTLFLLCFFNVFFFFLN